MSVTVTPELLALIEAGVITLEQATLAMAAAPAPNELSGFATCMNAGCEAHEVDRPVRLLSTTNQVWAVDLPVVLNETHYLEFADDADSLCPECGDACAVKTHKAPTYQRLV